MQLSAAELAAFAGRYRHPEAPFELTIETSGESLRLTLGDKPPVALRAISKETFELVGLPPGYSVAFERDAAGRTVALSFTEPGSPPARLPRVP